MIGVAIVEPVQYVPLPIEVAVFIITLLDQVTNVVAAILLLFDMSKL